MTPHRVLVEYTMQNDVSILGLDEDGFIISKTLVGSTNDGKSVAEELVGDAGWLCRHGAESWFEGNGCFLLDVFPKPVVVTVVGSEIPYTNEELVSQVRQNGVPEAAGIVNKVPADGKYYVTISLERPRGWEWQ